MLVWYVDYPVTVNIDHPCFSHQRFDDSILPVDMDMPVQVKSGLENLVQPEERFYALMGSIAAIMNFPWGSMGYKYIQVSAVPDLVVDEPW